MEGLSACRCLTIMPVPQWRNHLELGDAVRHAHCSCIKLERIHAVLVWILQKKCSYHERCMPEKCSHTSIWCGITVQGIRNDNQSVSPVSMPTFQLSRAPGIYLMSRSAHACARNTLHHAIRTAFAGGGGGGGEVTRL